MLKLFTMLKQILALNTCINPIPLQISNDLLKAMCEHFLEPHILYILIHEYPPPNAINTKQGFDRIHCTFPILSST